MARIEPPKLAEWMLENLIPASERDEALAGDLAEQLHSGRSDAWYRRQAAAAVATGWTQYLSRRGAMLVFALLWSTLAPAWYVLVNGIVDSHDLWNGSWPLALVAWIGLNAAFLWSGLIVYQLVHSFLGRPIPRREIRRAFWKVPLVFVPLAGFTFVMTAIFKYSVPALEQARLAASSWGQITDVGVFADDIRLPYFVALAVALWGTAHRLGANARSPLGNGAADVSLFAPDPALTRPFEPRRFFAMVVAAGVINALLSGFLLCRLPDAHAPSFSALLLRAAIFVAFGAATGAAGAWIYWNNPASPFRDSAPVDFRLFALAGAAGWLWMPALILLYQQVTAFTAFVAAIGAFALAAGLRRIPMEFEPVRRLRSGVLPPEETELFSDPVLRPRAEGSGTVVALAIYAGGFAIVEHSFLGASMLLGLAGFLLGWRRTVQRREARSHDAVRAFVRLAAIALPAVLITAWALLTGVAHRNQMAVLAATQAAEGKANAVEKAAAQSAARGFGGYESVILWPWPEKKQIAAPIRMQSWVLTPGNTRPLVIPFDGPYWYLQPPDQRPGTNAHQAHGSPLGVRIEANDSLPLVMEARQRLATAIPVARCGQIDVEIENRDQHLGVVGMALVLEDSAAPKSQLFVGRQHIVTGQPGRAGIQTLHFAIPQSPRLRRFDEITLMLLPETARDFHGPQIAVREFSLYSRP